MYIGIFGIFSHVTLLSVSTNLITEEWLFWDWIPSGRLNISVWPSNTLFFLFLVIYAATALGNLGLIILVLLNSHLHTPMYFFLWNLSFIDLCYSSVLTPKMLMNFILRRNVISDMGYMTQLCLFCFFVISECLCVDNNGLRSLCGHLQATFV
jgi:hypothetical protein